MTRQIGGFGEQLLARFGGGPARMRLHAEADAALERAGGEREEALAAFERAVHAHAHAMRLMAKALIRDVWRAERGLPPRRPAAIDEMIVEAEAAPRSGASAG